MRSAARHTAVQGVTQITPPPTGAAIQTEARRASFPHNRGVQNLNIRPSSRVPHPGHAACISATPREASLSLTDLFSWSVAVFPFLSVCWPDACCGRRCDACGPSTTSTSCSVNTSCLRATEVRLQSCFVYYCREVSRRCVMVKEKWKIEIQHY